MMVDSWVTEVGETAASDTATDHAAEWQINFLLFYGIERKKKKPREISPFLPPITQEHLLGSRKQARSSQIAARTGGEGGAPATEDPRPREPGIYGGVGGSDLGI